MVDQVRTQVLHSLASLPPLSARAEHVEALIFQLSERKFDRYLEIYAAIAHVSMLEGGAGDAVRSAMASGDIDAALVLSAHAASQAPQVPVAQMQPRSRGELVIGPAANAADDER